MAAMPTWSSTTRASPWPHARAPTPVPEPDEGTSRISFRLPESLKSRVEDAAAADGLSVNAWLVRAVTQTLDGPRTRRVDPRRPAHDRLDALNAT